MTISEELLKAEFAASAGLLVIRSIPLTILFAGVNDHAP
jgi:hypothetical protein